MNDVAASLPLMLKHLRLGSIKDHWQPLADKAVTEHWRPEQYLSELCALELQALTALSKGSHVTARQAVGQL